MRESFILYTENMKQVELLTMEQRGVLFTAVMRYEREEELPEMDGVTPMCFSFIQGRLDRDAEAYDKRCEQNKANGSKGGRPKTATVSEEPKEANGLEEKPKKPNGFSENQTKHDNEPDPDNDNDLSTPPISPSRGTRFVKPTKAEVDVYIREHGYHFSADAFIAFYESNGWKVGKNPMKSWQQACVTWEARRKEEADTKQTARSGTKRNARPEGQHDYDWDSIESMLLEAQARGA